MTDLMDFAAQAPADEQADEAAQRVTALELFFDLVFVFAITQVTGFVSARPTVLGLVQGLAILAVLWFAWSGYAWLGNNAHTDDGAVRVVLLMAMAAMLVVSLAVPRAFGGDGLVFGLGYLTVRALHILCYTVLARARADRELGGAVARLASTILPAAALIAVAGAVSGTARTVCWVAAILVDYGGLMVRGVDGWRVEPAHFAERHGGIVIIALGESIVALGAGAHGPRLGAGVIAGALLGIATAAALWWAYFDVVAIVGERRLRRAAARERALMARDSYTYLHLPMVGGIILFAIGVKQTLLDRTGHLPWIVSVALYGGIAVYLLALSAFKRRNIGSWNVQRLIAAGAMAVLIVAGRWLPALGSLALVTAGACGLITFERLRFAEARGRIRRATPD